MDVSSLNREYVIHKSSVVDAGYLVRKNTIICYLTQIMSGSAMGQNVFIPSTVHIENGVKVRNNVSRYEGVVIQDDVFLGLSCVFTHVLNPCVAVERKTEYKTTLIKEKASIGANATVVCGVTISKFAFVGAGAAVTKDTSDDELVVGNPSKCFGWMSEHGEKLCFNQNVLATCYAQIQSTT